MNIDLILPSEIIERKKNAILSSILKAESESKRISFRKIYDSQEFGAKDSFISSEEDEQKVYQFFVSYYNDLRSTIQELNANATNLKPAYSKISALVYNSTTRRLLHYYLKYHIKLRIDIKTLKSIYLNEYGCYLKYTKKIHNDFFEILSLLVDNITYSNETFYVKTKSKTKEDNSKIKLGKDAEVKDTVEASFLIALFKSYLIKELNNNIEKEELIYLFSGDNKQLIGKCNLEYKDIQIELAKAYSEVHEQIDIYIKTKTKTSSSNDMIENIKEEPIVIQEEKKEASLPTINLNPFYPPTIERKEKYTINNKDVYVTTEGLNNSLREQGFQIEANDKDYKLAYYKNIIGLQELANSEIEEYASELKDELLSNKQSISKYGFSRIQDIDNPLNIFNILSKDYPDFKNSKAIKDKNYFEIILEYKKGTATRDYLDLFLEEKRSKHIDKIFTEEEFDYLIDEALYEWNVNINKARIRSNDMLFFSSSFMEFIFTKSESLYMPKEEWFNHKITFDLEIDKKNYANNQKKELFKKLLKTNHLDIAKLIDELTNKENTDLQNLWIVELFHYDITLYNESPQKAINEVVKTLTKYRDDSSTLSEIQYEDVSLYEKLVNAQYKWIFEYNKNILESKKNYIEEKILNRISNNI
ncbi:hypothetical protein [Poseidonibacter ostreae]|uniref:Uncharacterized protein n=1 Tax=Poseidonibacter ostreae TaxID=2654171 RepID=A0A6L4WXW8_9BACT|nr:hypothetical protein [Poseidonibacter ostreae]KAB7891300.1 hypothetical protein GBG19_00255 [Poseidonibacter ostreae]